GGRGDPLAGTATLVLGALLLAAACGGAPPASAPGNTGTVTPSFLVTHVIYATLANAHIEYQARSTFGATTSATRSFKEAIEVEASAEPVPIVPGGEVEIAVGRSWGSTRRDAPDLTTRRRTVYLKEGRTDAIDHGEDELWLLLQPALDVTVTPAT